MITELRQRTASISNQMVMGILIGIALTAVAGSIGSHIQSDNINWWAWMDGFLQNFGTEMFGAFLTFGLIEVLLGSRQESEDIIREAIDLKKSLLRQMRSSDNGIALQALEEIKEYNWHKDGSLNEARMRKANLVDALLGNSNLQGIDLSSAVLQNSNLVYANLSHAFLYKTDLRNANLSHANLQNVPFQGADLSGANLSHADLRSASLDECILDSAKLAGANLENAFAPGNILRTVSTLRGATMRDGTLYDGRFNLVGDIESAKEQGINTDDKEAMKAWYEMRKG